MVERCIKCRNEIHLCTCYICPIHGEPLEEFDSKGICPVCGEMFDLSDESENKVASFFITFKNLLRENLPFERTKEILLKEIANSGRRTLIQTLGGIPEEDLERKGKKRRDEDDDEEDNEIKIEGPERIEMIKCPICNVHISRDSVKTHGCFQ